MDLLGIFSGSKDTRQLAPGETLFKEGDPGTKMFVVLDGKLSVEVKGRAIDSAQAGDIIGEMAMIDDRPRSASVVAATESRVVPVDAAWFKILIRNNPDFAIHVMSVIAERLRERVAEASGTDSTSG